MPTGRFVDYKVRIINGTTGTAAKTRVLNTSTDGKREWGTVGVSENIIEASLQALVAAGAPALIQSRPHDRNSEGLRTAVRRGQMV